VLEVPSVMFDVPFPPGLAATFAQLAISQDGHDLAVAPTFEGRAPLWLRPIDSSAGRILPGTEGATFPFWSSSPRSSLSAEHSDSGSALDHDDPELEGQVVRRLFTLKL